MATRDESSTRRDCMTCGMTVTISESHEREELKSRERNTWESPENASAEDVLPLATGDTVTARPFGFRIQITRVHIATCITEAQISTHPSHDELTSHSVPAHAPAYTNNVIIVHKGRNISFLNTYQGIRKVGIMVARDHVISGANVKQSLLLDDTSFCSSPKVVYPDSAIGPSKDGILCVRVSHQGSNLDYALLPYR